MENANCCDRYWSDRPELCQKFKGEDKNGNEYIMTVPILSAAQVLIWLFWWASFIEHFKALVVLLFTRGETQHSNAAKWRAIAIDAYQVIKWSILILFLYCGWETTVAHSIVVYLLASNLFSYFYYHAWRDPWGGARLTHSNLQRRLVSFLMAFAFMIFGYAALYYQFFADQIIWPGGPDGVASFPGAIFLSVANTFTLTYGEYGPGTAAMEYLFGSQVVYAFVFLVIIISNSVPRH